MPQFYTLLTDVGQAKLANAVALGGTIEITELAVGDGGGSLPTPDSSAESLVNEVRRAAINASETHPDNPSWIVVEQVLPPDVGGWTIREIGIYDVDGDLIGIGNYPETYKPVLSEGSSRTQTVRFVLEVSDTSAVTLRVDPSVVLATREYVDAERAKHEASRSHPAATTTAKGFVELATQAETDEGTDTTRAVVPARLAQSSLVRGRENEGNPNGVVAAHQLFERCWDISKAPPRLYIATAADGTTGGSTWTRMADLLSGKSLGDVAQYEDDGAGNSILNQVNMPRVSGIPVVESDSNSDGEWTRWADGTQICRVHGTMTYDGPEALTLTWTYPQAFVGTVFVLHTPTGILNTGANQNEKEAGSTPMTMNITTIDVDLNVESHQNVSVKYDSGDTWDTNAIAIGSWL